MFLILSLVFAGISLIALIVGGVLTLILACRDAKSCVSTGRKVGAEIMSDHLDREAEGPVVARRSFFVGRAASVERQATIDFAEVKQQLAAGNCLSMIPSLLAIGGFVGLFFFGGLAVLFGVPNVLIGGAVMLVVLYALVRMGIALIRA